MNFKNIFNKKANVTYLEILILITSIFAIAYIIGSAIQGVDAVVPGYGCCEETKDGHSCQYVPQASCNLNFVSSECSETSYCQKGCCISSQTGFCSKNSAQRDCKTGTWKEDENCNYQECKNVCCILGDQGIWTNEKGCEIESLARGKTANINRNVQTDIECNYIAGRTDKGACVFYSDVIKKCLFTTREDCYAKTHNLNDFYKNTYCSDSQLNTTCRARNNTGCLNGKESVYWFDSCGNQEGTFQNCSILSGSICGKYRQGIDTNPSSGNYVCRDLSCKVKVKTGSLQQTKPRISGKIITKEQADKMIGNRTLTPAGLLQVSDTSNQNNNVNVNANSNIVETETYVIKKNGESWCEYDGTIGNGKDVVGSRHIKHMCFMGEEKIEPCRDYRNDICVQTDTQIASSLSDDNEEIPDGKMFSEASCRVNNWRSCLAYNTLEKSEEVKDKCDKNPDCFIKNIYVDEYFKFDFCVPHYPPGFDLRGNNAMGAQLSCNFASAKCTYAKENTIGSQLFNWWPFKGDWTQPKETNKNCLNAEFAEKMNDLCTSLGDCGAYVNYNGNWTDEGYSVTNSPRLSNTYIANLKQYSSKKPNQKPAEPGNLEFLGVLGKPENLGNYPGQKNNSGFEQGVLTSTGAMGVPALLSTVAGWGGVDFAGTLSSISGISATTLTSFINAAGSAAAGAAVGYAIAKAFGLNGDAAAVISITAGIAALITTFFPGVSVISSGFTALLSSLFWPLAIAVVVSLLLTWWFKSAGVGEVTTTVVEFKCLPWQPPNGGDECNKCGKDGVPCTDYRCMTLGKTCQLINKGTVNEACVNNPPRDITSPNIQPLYGLISDGYEYYNEQPGKDGSFQIVNSADKGCIDAFKDIVFGIRTFDSSGKDKPAICKYGMDPTQDYDEMQFFENNLNVVNHTMILNLPTPEALANQYNLTEEQKRQLGEVKLYIKCQSVNGARNLVPYTIKTCVKQGPDLEAPVITKTIPDNKAYVRANADSQLLKLFVNEPSNCKWSREDKRYEDMENTAECATLVEMRTANGYECRTNLTGLANNKKFYFKCRDISQNNNTMSESFVYELSSSSNLNIDMIEPVSDSVIKSASNPTAINLKVVTSGGAEDGKATCYFKTSGNPYPIRFFKTGSNEHTQKQDLIRGDYIYNFSCEDIAGNKAERFSSFRIYIDDIGPKIVRILSKNGLKIITNEKAECRYSFNENAVFENSTLMSGTNLEHTTSWQSNAYYIQCKDNFGNKGDRIEIKTYK